MVKSGSHQFTDDRFIDPVDQNSDVEESFDVSSSNIASPAAGDRSISPRMTDMFGEDGGDIGDGFSQWLGALDMQVMGACRADERLKPLLKLKISTGEAEDRLMAQLCDVLIINQFQIFSYLAFIVPLSYILFLKQHFEPAEVGLLARCLCTPLVSIRVGKTNKQGTLLSPTSTRGNLCLTLLPASDLHISFNGDDGSMERLVTLNSEAQCTSLKIEKIPADKSGRSFLLRIADNVVFYFWCSEKSQLLGNELLKKMKDLVIRKPSLAELTGISHDRLNYFATQLRAYLGVSTVFNAQCSGVLPSSCPTVADSFDSSKPQFSQSSFTCEEMPPFQQCSSKRSTSNPNHLGGLCSKSSSFEVGLLNSLMSEQITARSKLMQVGDDYILPNSMSLPSKSHADLSSFMGFGECKLPEANLGIPLFLLNVVDACKSLELPHSGQKVQVPCLPTESFHLPPLSSLLSAAGSPNHLTSKSSLNLSEVPVVDFPRFQPEPLISLPPSQIPTFTPMICDPIVHIPMIDACSSGPSYSVSGGLAIATTIPLSNPNLVDPPISNSESVVEKSARETLRMLINSSKSQTNLQLYEVLPPVFSSNDKPNVVNIGGSSGVANMGLMFLSEVSVGGSVGKVGHGRDEKERLNDSDSSGFDTGME